MASAQLRDLLNGPVVAGVGATVDAGLPSDKFHVLPWDPSKKLNLSLTETSKGMVLGKVKKPDWYQGDIKDILKYAVWNTNKILDINAVLSHAASASDDFTHQLRLDVIAIVFLQMAYGYYDGECRAAKGDEPKQIEALTITDEYQNEIVNMTRLNRAATFILARMHTKYQTNHALGGTPMQASMASSVRAFYQVSPSAARSVQAQSQIRAIYEAIYWAVHPANETLLIPCVIQNTQIDKCRIHMHGPEPQFLAVEEYFQIRARTPPASTHHFYVAAAAIKQLEPLGILPYLPEPTRTKDVVSGLRMIAASGAKLHPAARFWGLERLTGNQKLVETICSDLGYAVRKLMPASSLSASPILSKEDGLDSAWKGLIDAIRSAMDERGKELLDDKIFAEIRQSIAPAAAKLEGVSEIKGYLMHGKAEAIESEDEDDEDDDEEEEDDN